MRDADGLRSECQPRSRQRDGATRVAGETLGDALFLRHRIVSRLEQAELQPDPVARRWLTTFVVIGGGFSGVETAGVLTDFLRASLKCYPRIKRDDIRVVLLHSQNRLLPELSASLGEFAGQKMRMHGLDVRLEARAARLDDPSVILASVGISCGNGRLHDRHDA